MKIGLTYTGSDAKHKIYSQWLAGEEDIEVIKLCAEDAAMDLIDECDALALSGGVDMHPDYYKGKTQYPGMPNNFDSARDAFELKVLGIAIQNAKPVFGICRGLQLINVYCHGTLMQDIGERIIQHRGNPDKEHIIHIEAGALLYDITGVLSETANTAHHQAIDSLGDELMVNCYSEDGLIEGIEWQNKNNKPFMLAVQWHPERMKDLKSPLSKNIRDRFIDEIKLNTGRK